MNEALDRLKAALADRYRIERELGAGGMATVHLAHDLKHDRKVALKVLRPELSAILGGERFLVEIKTTAGLQHPHILPLFDSGTADGFLYYVMPFIEGETLRDALDRETQLGIDEAVRIAADVAEALDYAHRHGVIHRDIKPENILIHDGRSMVADFGIALAVSAAAGGRMTETGLSLGTPHYMSPEQATAEKDLTPRSDIYSLGVVLYEMLAGKPPHFGATAQQIIMKIVTEDPAPVASLRRSVPANVAAAVGRALEKVPADRFATAKAFVDALRDPAFRSVPAGPAAAPRERRWVWQVGAAVGLVAAGMLLGTLLSRPRVAAPGPVARFDVSLPESEALVAAAGVNLALAPGGSRLVYVGASKGGEAQLWQRPLDALRFQPIPGTDGARIPAVSPNDSMVAFTVNGALKTVSFHGGPPVTLVASGVPSVGGGIAWADDGQIYFVDSTGAIQRVPAAGGPPSRVVSPATGGGGYMWIDALPGGKGLLLTLAKLGLPETSEIVAVATAGGPVRKLVKGTMARYLPAGYLVYTTVDGTMMAAPFDAGALEVTGAAVALFNGVDVYMGSASQFAVSRTGTLAWVGNEGLSEVVRVDRTGTGGPVDPGWTGELKFLALAPDGVRLIVNTSDASGAKLWIKQLDRGPLSPLAFDGNRNVGLSWSPDGQLIAVLSNRSGPGQLWLTRADGTKAAERVPVDGNPYSAVWTPDGREIVIGRSSQSSSSELIAYRPGPDSATRALIGGTFLAVYPSVSSDGRWLAYSSNEPGHDEVFVRPFPNVGDGKWQVSTAGGMEPVWAHSSRELFFRTGAGDLVVAQVGTEPSRVFRFGAPKTLFAAGVDDHTDGKHYDVTPDDQHFLLVRPVGGSRARLVVVENFGEELRRKAPR